MKFNTITSVTIIALSLTITACTTIPNNMPLVFGEDISLGISMGGSTTSQGAELTLGFKSKDVAIIPVVAASGTDLTKIQGEVNNMGTPSGVPYASTQKDAYSVLGQFGTTTDNNGKRIGIGKFFATGRAATSLADGFSKALAASSVN